MSDTRSESDAVAELIELWEGMEPTASGQSLYESYAESVSHQFIDALTPAQLTRLRNHLRDHDVQVRHGQGIPIARALHELLPHARDRGSENARLGSSIQEGQPPDWSGTPARQNNLLTLLRMLGSVPKFDGTADTDLNACEQEFKLACSTANVGAMPALDAMHLVLCEVAKTHFLKRKDTYIDSNAAFDDLRKMFFTPDVVNAIHSEWTNLSLTGIRRQFPEKTTVQLLDALWKRAVNLQTRLHTSLQTDQNLLITLKRAVQGERCAASLVYHPPNTAMEAIARLKMGAEADITSDVETHWTANQYDFKRKKKNKLGRDGKPLRCNICRSEFHLFRTCPRATAADDVRLAEMLDNEQTRDHGKEEEYPEDCRENKAKDDDFDEDAVGTLYATCDSTDEQDVITETDVFFASGHGAKVERPLLPLCIDTGAPRSVVGFRALESYRRRNRVHIRKAKPISFRFGDTVLPSVGSVQVRVPTDSDEGMFMYDTHVVNDNGLKNPLPFLMGMDALHGVTLQVGDTPTLSLPGGHRISLQRQNGHLVSQREVETFYTIAEATKMHRRFGHLPGARIMQLVRKADPLMNESDLQDLAQKLGSAKNHCQTCEEHEQRPLRPSVAARWPEDIHFNREVIMDLFFVDGDPILQMVCRDTGYTLAHYLQNKSAKEVIAIFLREWVAHTSGLPETVKVDQGSEFVNMLFCSMINAMGVNLETSGVEGHWQMGRGEQAHGPLKQVLAKLKQETHSELGKSDLLALATKAMNDGMNPSGLVPTLLVFGCMPRTPIGSNIMGCPDQRTRMELMKLARTEYELLVSRERLNLALSARFPAERIMKAGDRVKVYRFKRRLWEGPFELQSVDYKSNVAIVKDKGGSLKFSVAVVRPYREPATGVDRPEAVYASETSSDADQWLSAKCDELSGLQRRGVFDVVSEPKAGAIVLRTKWVLTEKKGRMKARLTVLGHLDRDKNAFVSEAPTLRMSSTRIILTKHAATKGAKLWVGDVDQAYLQSLWTLGRDIYIVPPAEWDGVGLWLLRLPLYGLVDSATYWSKSILKVLNDLGLKQSLDPCMLSLGEDDGIIGVYVDDLLCCGDKNMSILCNELEKRLEMKARKILTDSNPIDFAGLRLHQSEDGIQVKQNELVDFEAKDFKTLRSLRGKLSWLVNGTRPDLSYICAQLMQVSESNYDQERVNTLLRHAERRANMWKGGMVIKRLDWKTCRIMVFADAAFANNLDLTSQLGFIVCVMDASGKTVPIFWASKKAKRITRSILAAEVLALADGFDNGSFIASTMRSLGLDLPLFLATDSRSIFDAISTERLPNEKRLALDISILREAFKNKEVDGILWIRSEGNPADGLTKLEPNKALLNLMKSGCVNLTVEQQIKQATTRLERREEERVCSVACTVKAEGGSRRAAPSADKKGGATPSADKKQDATPLGQRYP